MSASERKKVLGVVSEWARQSFRVIALAHKVTKDKECGVKGWLLKSTGVKSRARKGVIVCFVVHFGGSIHDPRSFL
jgi:hypothetical protein